MNELEKRLYSWTPRRPSARLERRLVCRQACSGGGACSVPVQLAGAGYGRAGADVRAVQSALRAALSASAAAPAPMVAMILSNQSAAAYLPGSFQAEQNNLPADAFKWIRGSGSPHDAASSHGPRCATSPLPLKWSERAPAARHDPTSVTAVRRTGRLIPDSLAGLIWASAARFRTISSGSVWRVAGQPTIVYPHRVEFMEREADSYEDKPTRKLKSNRQRRAARRRRTPGAG